MAFEHRGSPDLDCRQRGVCRVGLARQTARCAQKILSHTAVHLQRGTERLLRYLDLAELPHLRHRASPSTTSSAPSSRSDASVSSDPSTCRTRSRRNALILSVMICERSPNPFLAVAPTTARTPCNSVT